MSSLSSKFGDSKVAGIYDDHRYGYSYMIIVTRNFTEFLHPPSSTFGGPDTRNFKSKCSETFLGKEPHEKEADGAKEIFEKEQGPQLKIV